MDKPKLKLIGKDGNAFSILGEAISVARESGWTKEQVTSFNKEALSGDYDHLLQTCMKYFDVE
jgi:hypothetical protein